MSLHFRGLSNDLASLLYVHPTADYIKMHFVNRDVLMILAVFLSCIYFHDCERQNSNSIAMVFICFRE